MGEEVGNPDGMKVDVQGHVYCTGPGGIHIFDSSGSYLRRVKVPEHCSNMAWGDADWKTLFMTVRTSVYRMRLTIQGIPVWRMGRETMAGEFEHVGDSFGDVLDGPVWDGEGLLFCKLLNSEVFCYDGKSGKISTFRPFSTRTSELAFGPNGQLYGAQSGAHRVVW